MKPRITLTDRKKITSFQGERVKVEGKLNRIEGRRNSGFDEKINAFIKAHKKRFLDWESLGVNGESVEERIKGDKQALIIEAALRIVAQHRKAFLEKKRKTQLTRAELKKLMVGKGLLTDDEKQFATRVTDPLRLLEFIQKGKAKSTITVHADIRK